MPVFEWKDEVNEVRWHVENFQTVSGSVRAGPLRLEKGSLKVMMGCVTVESLCTRKRIERKRFLFIRFSTHFDHHFKDRSSRV